MVHTGPTRIGTSVWESSVAFVSKVSEVDSLENRQLSKNRHPHGKVEVSTFCISFGITSAPQRCVERTQEKFFLPF